jgi:hypothetical protein
LEHTPSICSLPERKIQGMKTRNQKPGEKIKGPVQTGPRGGKYFVITEKSKNGTSKCKVKVYIKN